MAYVESNKTQLRTAFASGLYEGLAGMLSTFLHDCYMEVSESGFWVRFGHKN